MKKQHLKFPSLELGYEQIKNTLQEQGEVVCDYANRALILFAIATVALLIGLPLLLTRFTSRYLVYERIPLTVLSVIPILIFLITFVYFWKIYKMKFFITYANPSIIREQFIELEPEEFYSEMMKHIIEVFDDNELIITQRGRDLKRLVLFTLLGIIALIILTLLSKVGF